MTSAAPEQRPTAAECAEGLRAATGSTTTRRMPPTRFTTTLRTPLTRSTTTRRVPLVNPVWRERFVPSAVLLVLYTIVLFQPGHSYDDRSWTDPVIESFGRQILEVKAERFSDWGSPAWGTLTTLGACLGVATLLITAVTLVPGSRMSTRWSGYGAAVLTVVCLWWQATADPPPPYFDSHDPRAMASGMWLFYLVTALTVATYAYRELRTRPTTAQP